MIVFAVGVSGCAKNSAPNAEVNAPSDVVEISAEPTIVVTAVPAAKPKRKFLGFLKPKAETTTVSTASIAPIETPSVEASEPVQVAVAAPTPVLEAPQIETTVVAANVASSPSMTDEEIAARGREPGVEPPSKRPRLFGFLKKRPPAEESPPVFGSIEPVEYAPSMTDEEIANAGVVAGQAPSSTKPRLFGFLKKRVPGDVNGAPEANIVLASTAPLGSTTGDGLDQPYVENSNAVSVAPAAFGFGNVVSACGVKKRHLGTEVARSPGAGTYRLYDTAPSSVEPRVQYITGFKDKCPRKIWAALVLFGSAQVHETHRYNPRNGAPYSAADDAYERAKNRICRVGKGEPCPAGKYEKLENQIGLVTAYPRFGGTGDWMNLVILGGKVAALSVN